VEMGSRPGAANRADRTFNASVGPDRLRVPIYGWIWFCTPVRRNLPRRVGTREYIKYNRGPFDAVCTRIGVSNSWRRSRHVSATWKITALNCACHLPLHLVDWAIRRVA